MYQALDPNQCHWSLISVSRAWYLTKREGASGGVGTSSDGLGEGLRDIEGDREALGLKDADGDRVELGLEFGKEGCGA